METKNTVSVTEKEFSDVQVTAIDISSLDVIYHPRKNFGNIESLQSSIKRDGLQEPLLVYECGENKYAIIDGYRRFMAVKEFGWQKVPCIIKKDIVFLEAAHLSYVKNAERSGFDPIEIALHLKAMIQDFGFSLREMELKGYGSPSSISNKMKLLNLPESIQIQIEEGKLTAAHGLALVKLASNKEQQRMAKRIVDDDLTAKRALNQINRYLAKGKKKDTKPKVQVPSTEIPGVYIKDSRDMSELPDKSVHMIMSSPPYNVGMEYEKGIPFDEHLEMVKDVLKECARVLVPGGIMALNVGDINIFKGPNGKNDFTQIELMGHRYQNWLRKYQIYLTDLIIWKKSMPWATRPHVSYTEETVHTSYRILDNFEPVYIFRKKGEREVPSEEVVLKSRLIKEQWAAWAPAVWEIPSVKNQEGHPSIYPDELCLRLIKMFSYETDTVLDPWLGSGTTVKVARELNREAIGYEKEPQYKAVIMEKLGIAPEKAKDGSVDAMIENIEEIKTVESEHHERPVEPVKVDTEEQGPIVEYADGYAEADQIA
ncbi:MAG: ParB/RepB/Spo0J family partition protein [Deltaproteobacteria bacterium]|nr:ParB/RepB/Spo0J family partition protein [Deltaproteobacteria bacterium]